MSTDSRVNPLSARSTLPVRQGRRVSPCVFHALDDDVALCTGCLAETRGQSTSLALSRVCPRARGNVCGLTRADKHYVWAWSRRRRRKICTQGRQQ
jgi:hypothetical protein